MAGLKSLFRHFFEDPEVRALYSQRDDLAEILKSIESYCFLLYEKVSIIVEIKNKYYDICQWNRGYIAEDEKRFLPKDTSYRFMSDKDRSLFYFKHWTNKRLLRILKILKLEARGISVQKKSIADCLAHAIASLPEDPTLQHHVLLLKNLELNVRSQQEIIEGVYPVRHWSMQLHQFLIAPMLLDLIRDEIQLMTGLSIDVGDYNNYPAVLLEGIRKHTFPVESTFAKLLAQKHATINAERTAVHRKIVTCYHGRPIYIHTPLFPLEIKNREAGFFIDVDYEETINIIRHIRDIRPDEIEVFEITMPLHAFQKAIYDVNPAPYAEHDSYYHAFVIRPTLYPLFNEYYRKGLITVRRCNHRPNFPT